VVTGASDGIGRQVAIELARSGLDVALVARRRERLDALPRDLSDRHQVATRVVAADLASPSGIDAVVAPRPTSRSGCWSRRPAPEPRRPRPGYGPSRRGCGVLDPIPWEGGG